MTPNIARPADVFFYDDSHSLCTSPYALPLRSDKDISNISSGKKVLFITDDEVVSSRLLPVFESNADNVQTIYAQRGDLKEFSMILDRFSCKDLLIVLAVRNYSPALTVICSTIQTPVPVVLPTGFVVLASPQAQYAIQNAACSSYSDLRQMLSQFKNKRLLIWNQGPFIKYEFMPVLKELGMLDDVVGIIDDNDSFEFDGAKIETNRPGDWIAHKNVEVVLVAQGAAETAFKAVQSLLPDFTPLLMHASRIGVLESFHSVVTTHSLFTGEDGLLEADQVPFEMLPPLDTERYEMLHEGYAHRSETHYENIINWSTATMLGNGFSPADMETPFVNCHDGLRKTAFQPDQWDSMVHIFGASNAFGAFADDESTPASQMQKNCVEAYESGQLDTLYKVVNYATNASSPDNCFRKMHNMQFNPGEKVIFITIPYWLRTHTTSFIKTITAMHHHCLAAGAEFSLYLWPELMFSHAPSLYEQKLIKEFQLIIGELTDSPTYPAWDASLHNQVLKSLQNAGVTAQDLQPYFERPHNHGELFIDIGHTTHIGLKIAADILFEQTIKCPAKSHVESVYEEELRDFGSIVKDFMLSNDDFVSFLENTPRFNAAPGSKIGAVVVNCNPFTLGHRHLMQHALQHVDYLYVFVVEEDESYYSTSQRYEMVCAGLEEFGDKVIVAHSGPGIISSITFAEYFTKEKTTDYKIDVAIDGLIFGNIVCKEFGITERFFGEEPSCMITKEYMRQLLEILPLYGVSCDVIPRLESDGTVLSASLVRALYEKHDWEAISSIVPETTLAHLKMYSDIKKTA